MKESTSLLTLLQYFGGSDQPNQTQEKDHFPAAFIPQPRSGAGGWEESCLQTDTRWF